MLAIYIYILSILESAVGSGGVRKGNFMKKHSIATKALVLLLVALFVLPLSLIGCAQDDAPGADTTVATDPNEPAVTTTEAVETTPMFEEDNIPEDAKFNNEKCRLLVWNTSDNEFYSETTSGDTISNSIYERNLDVEIRLEVELDFTEVKGGSSHDADYVNAVKTAATSNEDNFDLLAGYGMNISACIIQGLLGDIKELPTVELDRTWYNQSSREAGTLAGKSFLVTGDISFSHLGRASGIFFNDDLRIAQNIEDDPYQLVIEDKWTIKKFISIIENVYSDTNGNSTRDESDIYGFVADHTQISAIYFAAGYNFCELDPETGNQIISDDVGDEAVLNMVDDWIAAVHGTGSIKVDTDDTTIFVAGNAVFWTYPLCYVSKSLRDATFKYGFVPTPKANENQKEYYSSVTNYVTLWGIPKNLRNADMTGAVLECMSSEGYRTITPAVFEVAYKTKYNSDASGVQSAIFDIIAKNIRFDFGRINSSSLLSLPNSMFANCVREGTNNYQTKAANALKAVQLKLDALISSVS